MRDIEKIYTARFNQKELENKMKIWKIIARQYFQKFIKKTDTVVDLGAGSCEFINNIQCKNKIAVDITDISRFANSDVKIVMGPCTNLGFLPPKSVNVVFVSNLLEHLRVENIEKCLDQVYRILAADGKILILQPNIKYAYREYWDFFDHVTPLSHKSTIECLVKHRFKIELVKERFLPYSTKSKLPKWPLLIRIYLKMPILQKIFGKQMFIVARKEN